MLPHLHGRMPGVVRKLLSFLSPESLLSVALTSKFLSKAITGPDGVAAVRVEELLAAHMFLSKWIRHKTQPLKEMFDIHRALRHQGRVTGRYTIEGDDCTLDISPLGRFVNFSSLHCFTGTYTITAVVESSKESEAEFYLLLDRWYTDCRNAAGDVVPATEMRWVDENYHCHSVAGSSEGGAYMENSPNPEETKGWDTSERNPVKQSSFKRTLDWPQLTEHEKKNKESHLPKLAVWV